MLLVIPEKILKLNLKEYSIYIWKVKINNKENRNEQLFELMNFYKAQNNKVY